MSCRMMGSPLLLLSNGGSVLALGIFGSGPNIAVGFVGSVASLGKMAIEELKALFFKYQLNKNPYLEIETDLLNKIKVAKEQSQICKKAAKVFTVCMVPLVGPCMALMVLCDE